MSPGERLRRWLRLPGLAAAVAAGIVLGPVARSGRRDGAVRAWGRVAAWALGLRVRQEGPLPPPGVLVAVNHVGYLDVVALAATVPGCFLAKSEVAGWPLLGRLAGWGGALFVERDRPRESRPLVALLARRLGAGDRVLLFPEAGVSADGSTLGGFRPMLFESCVAAGRPVVPVALSYREPADRRVWAWLDEPSLWRHLWRRVLPCRRIEVVVRLGQPLWPRPDEGRKELASRAQAAVAALLRAP